MDEQIETNLKKSLITRDPSNNLLILNFSSELFCILREVHYLKQMEVEDVPQVALDFADNSDVFRTYTLNLEKTIDWYNTIQENSSPVELKLIESEIKLIDSLVEVGINELVWNSEGKDGVNRGFHIVAVSSLVRIHMLHFKTHMVACAWALYLILGCYSQSFICYQILNNRRVFPHCQMTSCHCFSYTQ